MKFSDLIAAIFVVGIVLIIIIPVPSILLDFLLILNISLSIIILLTTMYVKDAMDFSIFPSILLITTLMRLSLNISSTRLILTSGFAGNVIHAFGSFVIGNNPIVGFIVFIIIAIVQFIVITKGAERVSEVSARFTLDAMPGKQMSIDADLNAGIINDKEAKERRKKIQEEAKFFGSMDGASKFVKGDAIVGIIIMIINIIAGLIIGMTIKGMDINQAINTYTILTVGDGLVSQIPALLISTATGIIVTRTASETNMGNDVIMQLIKEPRVLQMTGILLILMAFVPMLPAIPLLIIGSLFTYLGFANRKKNSANDEIKKDDLKELEEIRDPKRAYDLLQVDPIELEFGYELIPIASSELLDRIVMIRRQIALDLGLVVPMVRLRDNIQLKPNEYIIKIRGNEVGKGDVYVNKYLCMQVGEINSDIKGISTREPAFGLPALWIDDSEKQKAEMLGCTVVDVPSVISTHLTNIIKRHSDELLGRQEVKELLDNVKLSNPALVDEIVPKLLSLGDIEKVLCNLLREEISIRDMVTILETLADYAPTTKDTDVLTEYVRQSLKRAITNKYAKDGKLQVITLDPEVERSIQNAINQTEHGSYLALPPDSMQKILKAVHNIIKKITIKGEQPIILTAPIIRFYLRKLIEQISKDIVVLSYNELLPNVEVFSVGTVKLSES
ncbi:MULTISPECIES: flagellar biosynthesis protein FlhA [Thermoanaerobacterium]|uniref:Flagellar biosynthesis protein FlhA n=2 Tax=Thermoanaerobacterium TaxID=28895 RepID=W9EBI6_9THEO|nr:MULTISPECIES: flagellar biosynthesis protein FlhA [Thermoanaerobacterium]AFK86806.1 flagellar biosynthesis protein FlhA [Thermoanaerobacterium saccharolyticum JW/SL-YS485]ETO38576.1 flagellar biosynthesis protein FlhA [Thermoanaerobacterium aotearoense SCUT27]